MGCTGSKSKSQNDGFVNGKPSDMFPYDEIRKCTERGNGLLFRLVNFSTKQWAFYNDSKIYEFHVTVVFSDQCSVDPLGNTTAVTDPHTGRVVAKVVVYPGMTEPFVQGHIDGFDAEYQAVGLTDEYKKQRRRQKKAAKEQKAEKQGGGEVDNDELDEPAEVSR
ncbi:protein of unknown function DUF1935 [Trypanosoma melophagium]|uniref:protein of unknown function DUF1935 n=1 Tax=Trypanosoma melophagium TaxID=715481 RepID=UPI00351AB110|nr:protein of unknown function DUF1935 [Trypanosoma melophagium]